MCLSCHRQGVDVAEFELRGRCVCRCLFKSPLEPLHLFVESLSSILMTLWATPTGIIFAFSCSINLRAADFLNS